MNSGSKFFSNAAIYLGANILNAGIPFFLLPILTRVLTPADYGMVAMFSIVLSVLGAFTGLSVHGAVGVRYFQMDKKALAEYVGACVGILVISTTVLFMLIAVLGERLAGVTGVPKGWLLAGVVLSGLQFLGSIRLSLWQVAGDAKMYGLFQVSQSLLNAVMSLLLILAIGMDWEGRLLGQSAAVVLSGMIALSCLLRDRLLLFPANWRAQSRDALNFGVPLIPHVIGGLLIVAVDRFVIVRLLDVAHAGIYMVALQIGQALGLVTESFNKAYAPWLMKILGNPTEAMRIKIVKGTYLYFALVFGIATAIGLFAPVVLNYLVGESFRAAGELVIYIAFGFAFGGCYLMVTNYIFFEGRTKILALVSFITGLVNIPLMFVFVDRNGLIGAGQAFTLINALSFLGTWWLAQKRYPMPWLKAWRQNVPKQ